MAADSLLPNLPPYVSMIIAGLLVVHVAGLLVVRYLYVESTKGTPDFKKKLT